MSNTLKMLLILLGILALAVAYAVISWPRQARVAGDRPAVARADRSGSGPVKAAVSAVSEAPQEMAAHVAHNIFAPLFPPAPRPAPPKLMPPTSVGTVPTPAPPPPAAPVPDFLGLLDYEGGKRVFLSVSGEVYVVSAGEHFGPGNNYRLVSVSSQELVIGYDDDSEDLKISIGEQPISVLSSSGPVFRAAPALPAPQPAVREPENANEVHAPSEPGLSEEEVPFDKVIDE